MSTEMQTKVQASTAQNFTPVQTGLLQRQCALCNTPGLMEDSEKDKEKLTLQRSSVDQAGTTAVPPIVHEALRSPGQPLDAATLAYMEPRFGHDFSRVRVQSTGQVMIQTKLKINKPGDIYEQENDKVVELVPDIQQYLKNKIFQAKPAITPLIQRWGDEEDPIQAMFVLGLSGILQAKTEAYQNKTSMSDHLKSGLENLSSMDLSSVRVHYNSSKPIQLNSLAYTQGQNIHVGPGQEKHLPHEGWHAVQQMQGRVKPTLHAKGLSFNDDEALEREADVMGAKALQHITRAKQAMTASGFLEATLMQREVAIKGESDVPREGIGPSRKKVPLNFLSIPMTTPLVQRQAGGISSMPQTYTFEQRWTHFQAHINNPSRAVMIAEDIISTMNYVEAGTHAVELAFWLIDHGRWDLAVRALDRLENSIEIAWITGQLTPNPGGTVDQRLRPLVDRARIELRADHHDQAFRLLRTAFFLVQRLLESRSAQRRERLNQQEAEIGEFNERGAILAQARVHPMIESIGGYDNLPALFDLMREILGMYPQEQRAALLAGNTDRARHLSGLGLLLEMELQEYILSRQRATTLSTVAAYNSRGQRGFSLQGAQGRTEIVTPLPGTPKVDEMGLFPEYSSPFATERQRREVDDIISGRVEQMERMPPEIGLVESISGQETLITELYEHAPIRTAFPGGNLDMNNLNHRLRVWGIMLDIFESRSVAGLGGLYQLMSLMGRYLRVFTRHTQYNIRDFGTSYLRSELPVDFAGRVARDCGVYALKVAYEVYQAARTISPRLDLEFQLFTMLEHVSLVIFDNDHGEYYIVNNNEISRPRRGTRGSPEVLESVSETYGSTLGRENFVAPAQAVDLGDTSMADRTFRRQAWQHFRLAGLWGLAQVPGVSDQYRRYYEDLAAFDEHVGRLMRNIAGMSIANQSGLSPEQRRRAEAALSRMFTTGNALLTIFEHYDAYDPSTVVSQADPAVVLSTVVSQEDPAVVLSIMGPGWTPQRVARELSPRLYLSSHIPPGSAHPLTRLARALVHFRGARLGGDEANYVDRIRNHKELGPALIAYEQAGNPPNF